MFFWDYIKHRGDSREDYDWGYLEFMSHISDTQHEATPHPPTQAESNTITGSPFQGNPPINTFHHAHTHTRMLCHTLCMSQSYPTSKCLADGLFLPCTEKKIGRWPLGQCSGRGVCAVCVARESKGEKEAKGEMMAWKLSGSRCRVTYDMVLIF